MLFILLLKCWLLCSFGIPKPLNYFVLFHCFFKHFLSGIKWFIVYILFFFFFFGKHKKFIITDIAQQVGDRIEK